MADVDSVTSLPLSHSLLAFYREKLRDAQSTNTEAISILQNLQPELQHVHELEQSLASSINTIDAFEHENADMKALLAELIEENAKLRLGKNVNRDDHLECQLLQTLQRRQPIENHSSVITMLVTRCESLERLVEDAVTELERQRQETEMCAVTRHELQERLARCQDELDKHVFKAEQMPTMQDFELMKSEIAKLYDERLRERQAFKQLQTENEALRRGRPLQVGTNEKTCNHISSRRSLHVQPKGSHDDALEEDIERVSAKLKSLERFALKHMPGEEVKGVPEFFQTVDKTKYRIADIDDRLQRRIQERAQRRGSET